MSDWKVPLSDLRLSEEDLAALVEVYRSGWLSMGPETESFEAELAKYLGVRHAIALASGTAALHLLLAACGIGPGDEVIVPSMTFVATVNAIAYTGARPVFCDIADPSRPCLVSRTVELLIGKRTKGILAMPYGGDPYGIDELAALAHDRGLLLLLDAAHAIGARIGSQSVAQFGDGAAFSFFSNKNLAVGEGGMIATDDTDVARRVRLLRSHGMTTLTWDRHRGHASGYDVIALGYNYRIDEPRARLGRARLARLDRDNDRRAAAVERYRADLSDLPGIVPHAGPEPGMRSAHHLFTVLLDPSLDRDQFRAALAEAGVQTSVHYPPVHRFSVYADEGTHLPLTDDYAARTVTLPLFAHITEEQVRIVTSATARAVETAARNR